VKLKAKVINLLVKESFACSQFHQHLTRTFFANIFAPKNYNVTKEKLRKALLYKKFAH